MQDTVTDSQFYMWRTLFAVTHADNIVTSEEVEFMAHVLEDIDFSEDQTRVLKKDIVDAQDPVLMFKGITEHEDRSKFFEFARDLVWVDGDFCEEEQSVMVKLAEIHSQATDFDKLLAGNIGLQLEEDKSYQDHQPSDGNRRNIRGVIQNFRNNFMGWFKKAG